MPDTNQLNAGTWRSHKVFSFTGAVLPQHEDQYTELSVDADGTFRLHRHPGPGGRIVLAAGQWSLQQVRRRTWFCFGRQQAYELITLEPDNLVLAEPMRGEKIFFAPMPGWYARIEPRVAAQRHVAAQPVPGKTQEP
ncbi:MAG: hypothetical protein EOO16_13990 [Chitinophagaceae bacterium]|nr:MAG: hypothetical protein EOO16_13990 [Chitinophagaceae bacterium]